MTANAAILPTVLVGVHADPYGTVGNLGNPSEAEVQFTAIQTSAGAFGIDSQYANFTDFSTTNPLVVATWDIANSRTPMLTWKPNYLGGTCPKYVDITAGIYDIQLTDQANSLASLGEPILVRWAPAMDADNHSCPYIATTLAGKGTEFVASWQHMYTLIKTIAPNVQFIWAPNIHAFSDNSGNPLTTWMSYYPGDAYVDWQGTLLYNSTTTREAVDLQPLFNTWYDTVSPSDKPLILAETGAIGPDPQSCGNPVVTSPSPQDKWIWSMKSKFKTLYPAMKGVVYFDAQGAGGSTGCLDYTIRGDGLDQLVIMLANPYFQKKTP